MFVRALIPNLKVKNFVALSMEDFEWQDPLLITDASSLQQKIHTQTHRESEIPCSLEISSMEEDPDDSSPSKIDGRSELGFSLTSPDLVLCIDSPDIPNQRYIESPEFLKGAIIDVSLENGIEGSEIKNSFKTPTALSQDLCTESSFELVTSQLIDENSKNCTEMSINVGSTCGVVCQNGMNFSEDISFIGGDTVRTEDSIIGEDGEGSLYQTARSGNFSYHFKNLECGAYLVDLHFAEIVFTNGPPGKRIFDVFLQDQKAVSSLDIYARVGANVPLVISDLRTYIKGDEGISIRLEGVNGNPIVCGMSVRKDYSKISGEIELEGTKLTYMQQCESLNDIESCSNDGDLHRLQVEHAFQKKELSETKRVLEELKKENDLKSRECQEAWKSLIDLQNELMRKSMHVGSLAFAIEGQVKEKSRWFSSLRNLTRKLKILKMDHLKLSEEASVLKQYLVDAEGVNSTITDTLNQHVQLHEHIKTKFLQEVKEKKELYNKVLELTGNIRVFCRCRPMNNEEITGGASKAVEFEAAKEGELIVKSNGISRKIFKFDTVFSPEADQVEVFEETAPLASSVLDGYNVCIFAYGQTGTGKTFTMEGTNEARGVNYRTLEKLFQIIDERKNMFRYEVSVSVLEVYNEQIRDLLVSGSQLTTNAKRLEIKQVGEGEHHVPGLIEANVNNVCEVWDVLRTGSNGRAVGSTNANEHSSRSHCMHCVMVKGENLLNGECTKSKLWLVDLAGSERIAKSEVQGERLKETQNINRSLSALGDVISALATKSSHVPFRNSKLTHLLQDSLGGDSKTLMFVQISPNENDITETLCSLNFASRVRGIELGPAKKQTDNTELLKYKQMVEKLKQDMKSKDFQVRKMEDTNYDLELKMKERDVKNRNLQDKIKELESQLLVERKLGRQHVDSKIAEQHQKQEEQHHSEPMRASLSTKTLASISKSHFANKVDQDNNNNNNITRSSSENNKHSFWPPPTIGSTKNSIEKENNPKISDQFLLPNRIIGRASLCPTFQRIPSAATAPRRNSLIPFPTGTAKVPPSLLPLAPIQDDSNNDENEAKVACLPCDNSPNEQRNRSKKLGSVLRRSVQKKSHMMRSPMQPHLRRVGVNVGLEKLRVSIGGRGKNGQRLFLGNARRVVTRDTTTQTKQNHREKERGWNLGTRSRNVL